jgi:phosphoadenosine phosphosulfate reductase
MFTPKDGKYYGCFSGGKDSVVIKELARRAGVPVTWHYNVTTIDPPELVRFIRKHHPEVLFDRPKKPFFVAMRTRGFPTRRARWCCQYYKERAAPSGSRILVGVRAAESASRKKTWKQVMKRNEKNVIAVAPILYWSDDHVWEFIRGEGLPYCSLYDEGFHRLGCIGCPMAREASRKKEFARWPQYEKLWKDGFRRVWERRSGSLQRDGRIWFGDAFFSSWEEMWAWWLSNASLPGQDGDDCTMGLFT